MKHLSNKKSLNPTRIALAIAATLTASHAFADAVTDWNQYTILATKGVDPALPTGGNRLLP